jgi:chemotaxis protein methyltransferase CheR
MTGAAPHEQNRPRPREREFAFGEEDFAALRQLVKELTGINLTDQKRELVYGRLSRRLRALGLVSFRDYRELIKSDRGELVQLINAITTNLTAFFREAHHFTYLREQVLRPLAENARGKRRVRIWSAGCSTGEEPYSIAMSVLEALPDVARWDVRILATDLDSDVLERARRGVYSPERLRDLDPALIERYFTQVQEPRGPAYRVAPALGSMITFKQLNLMHPLPMKGPLDAIFCRNVVIYFDKDTQRDLFARVANLQASGAMLFLGHSETLFRAVLGVGGMNHFMLPEDTSSASNAWLDPVVGLATRYGSYAMESLINDLLKLGAARGRLEIKLFGGGRILTSLTDVGQRNIDFIRGYAKMEGYAVAAEDLGGTQPRKVVYFPTEGRVKVRRLRPIENRSIADREQIYMSSIGKQSDGGDVELFD